MVRTSTSMRFHLGSIPASDDFVPGGCWRALREPSPWLAQFCAVPIAVATAVLMAILWHFINPLPEVLPHFKLPAD